MRTAEAIKLPTTGFRKGSFDCTMHRNFKEFPVQHTGIIKSGLGICKAGYGYRVVDIKSGYYLLDFFTLKAAKQFTVAVLALVPDWSRRKRVSGEKQNQPTLPKRTTEQLIRIAKTLREIEQRNLS